jgi:integrase
MGHLAQWLEHLPYTQGVGGSSPSVLSRYNPLAECPLGIPSRGGKCGTKPFDARKFSAERVSRMSRRSFRDPSYRLHKQSGQAVVTLSDGMGGRRDILLGKFGTPDESPESWAEYYRVLAEWKTAGRRSHSPEGKDAAEGGLSVNELILLFWRHAEQHYRHPDGSPTSELDGYKIALRPLKELYGHTPAKDFGPLGVKAVREEMIRHPVTNKVKAKDPATGKTVWRSKVIRVGLSRKAVNQYIGKIKRVFKWAVSEQLVPPDVLVGLQSVSGLQAGRSAAPEPAPVLPVPVAHVEATLRYLTPHLVAMIRLQTLTGMRPGEVCAMRTADLETSGRVWFYRPLTHKTAWRGKSRVIAVGPRAQEVLKPWLRLNLEEYLFQPREVVQALRDARKEKKKTPLTPSQKARRPKRNPSRQPGRRYGVRAYGKAIDRAARKACVPLWNPNQLRHNHGTEVRRRYGLEAAQVALGHSQANVTEVYAERDLSLAERVAAEIG